MKLYSKLPSFCTMAIHFLFGSILCCIVLFHFFTFKVTQPLYLTLLMLVVFSLFCYYIFKNYLHHISKVKTKTLLIILVILCLIVKLSWIICYQIEPISDYRTFYDTANRISQNFFVKDSHYTQLFPHIFGYSSFLSFFFRIFGANHLIPPIINVILTTLSMLLLFYIGLKLSGIRMAFIASLLWILFPSQTIYNMFVLSEPLYTTQLLAIWAFITFIEERFATISKVRLLLSSLLLAVLLVLMNQSRPIAAIPLIALFIVIFIARTGNFNTPNFMWRKILFFGVLLGGYLILSFLSKQYVELRLGGECGFTPGYNIYVGFNVESSGSWNLADGQLLFHYSDLPGWSAADAQSQMLKLAKERILHGDIDFSELFYNKFNVLWGNDSAAVGYASSIFPNEQNRMILGAICNAFYYFLIVFSIWGTFVSFRKKDHAKLSMITLFFIGLTIAQMLVEVASRYHYSGTVVLVLLAAYGLSHIERKPKASPSDSAPIPVSESSTETTLGN